MLVVAAVASVQTGAALATRLFPTVGPAGAVFLRLVFSAVAVGAIARPRIRSIPGRHLLLAAAFGLVLAAMNLSFYLSIDRVPLGVAVTVEFLGPLAVAVAGSRRPMDLVWVGLAAFGRCAARRRRRPRRPCRAPARGARGRRAGRRTSCSRSGSVGCCPA